MPPVSEELLIHYATYCHKSLQIKCSTIKLYICGIRYKFLQSAKYTVFNRCCSTKLHRLESIYRGIKKSENQCKRQRFPITYSILLDICNFLRRGIFTPYTDQLLETACIIAFFGFLRCGEFSILSHFDPSHNLCADDINFNDDCAILHLKASKTDPFRSGVDIYLFENNSTICPVNSLKRYLKERSTKFTTTLPNEPFFQMENGQALTRSWFITHLKSVLQSLGYDPNVYNGHSFRIGAATSVATKIEDHLIQTLGRWSSLCYTRYIHTPMEVHRNPL